MTSPRLARLLLLRHAESTWNASGRWQGHGDPPLSARGREQAARLGEELASLDVEVLIASDLCRAAETAALVGERVGLEPRIDRRFRELHVGTWTGLSRREIASRDGETLRRFDDGDLDVRPGNGETRRELAERASGALDDVVATHAGRRVAIVTHSGLVRTLFPGVRLDNAAWVEVTGRSPSRGERARRPSA